MAIYIEIKKVKKNKYIYKVHSELTGKHTFFIEINPEKKTVSFLENLTTKPLKTFKFTDQETMEIKGINPKVVFNVLMKAYKALKDNNFPDDISYHS